MLSIFNLLYDCNLLIDYITLQMIIEVYAETIKCLTMLQSFSTGNPITDLIVEAKLLSSATSSLVNLHPSAPLNSSACSGVLAPGIGITLPWATSQFRDT